MPYDYIEEPERLGPYAGDLVRANLVRQVIPGAYVRQIPEFEEAFLDYLHNLGPRLDERRAAFGELGNGSRIHAEKMQDLTGSLGELRLAQPLEYPWFNVETETARDFMGYLAAVLGRHEDLGYTPLTDNPLHLSEFVSASTEESPRARLDRLRLDVLEDLLPAPLWNRLAQEILRNSERHGNLLGRFRRAVERELIAVADLSSEELREDRLALFREETSEDLAEIKVRTNESGWPDLVLGKIGAVAGAVPGAPWLIGLASAVFQAFRGSAEPSGPQPLLYAAYAQEELVQRGVRS